MANDKTSNDASYRAVTPFAMAVSTRRGFCWRGGAEPLRCLTAAATARTELTRLGSIESFSLYGLQCLCTSSESDSCTGRTLLGHSPAGSRTRDWQTARRIRMQEMLGIHVRIRTGDSRTDAVDSGPEHLDSQLHKGMKRCPKDTQTSNVSKT